MRSAEVLPMLTDGSVVVACCWVLRLFFLCRECF